VAGTFACQPAANQLAWPWSSARLPAESACHTIGP
jgi:hypothetical protein